MRRVSLLMAGGVLLPGLALARTRIQAFRVLDGTQFLDRRITGK
jgi:hypothetical protein